MKKLFKNANIVDVENERNDVFDILVEDGKVVEIEKNIVASDCKVFDLQGNYVLPPFVNSYCDSTSAIKNYFDVEVENLDFDTRKELSDLMLQKNILAGALFVNDINVNNGINATVLQNVENMEDNDFSNLSNLCAKEDKKLFMKVGQTLNELGSVDKKYGKMLSQVLEDFGLLDRKSIVVGGNCFEKDELQVFKQYDCPFVVLPNEDARCGRRNTNIVSLKNMDIPVGVGGGSFFETDFFAFMRQILMSQWAMFEDNKILSEKDVLKMCTNDGAKILEINSNVKTSSRANFIVVKKKTGLIENPIKDIVWESSKRDVLMSVLNGEILQENGKIFMKKMLDYDTIIEEIKNKLRRI